MVWGFEICSKLRPERRHDDIVRTFGIVSPSAYFAENQYEQRSTLMRTSCVEGVKIMIRKTSSITGKRMQRPGFLRAGSIILASTVALGLCARGSTINLPGQPTASGNQR